MGMNGSAKNARSLRQNDGSDQDSFHSGIVFNGSKVGKLKWTGDGSVRSLCSSKPCSLSQTVHCCDSQ
jgi:hypothetical protein